MITSELPTLRRCVVVAVATLAAIFALGFAYYFVFVNRYPRIESWWWHLRHGGSETVFGYVIPVPKDWWVQDTSDNWQFLVGLENHAGLRGGKIVSPPSISLMRERPEHDVAHWTSTMAEIAQKNEHVTPSLRRIDIGEEKLYCYGRPQTFLPELDAVMWNCRADALGIMITASEADMPKIWDIVSGIRKKAPMENGAVAPKK